MLRLPRFSLNVWYTLYYVVREHKKYVEWKRRRTHLERHLRPYINNHKSSSTFSLYFFLIFTLLHSFSFFSFLLLYYTFSLSLTHTHTHTHIHFTHTDTFTHTLKHTHILTHTQTHTHTHTHTHSKTLTFQVWLVFLFPFTFSLVFFFFSQTFFDSSYVSQVSTLSLGNSFYLCLLSLLLFPFFWLLFCLFVSLSLSF